MGRFDIQLSAARFRVVILVFGVVAFTVGQAAGGTFWPAVILGAFFGTGGLLFTHLTNSRFGDELTAWVACSGALPLGISWISGMFGYAPMHVAFWIIAIQYMGTVYVCWGLLMFALRWR